MEPPPSCRRLRSPEDRAFGPFQEIYEEAIPLRERKPRHQMEALARREDYHLLVMESAGEVRGFSLLFLPPAKDFFLLEYMAVHQAHRSRGLGAALFRASLAQARSDGDRDVCLIEVESPRGASPDQSQRERRQAFYRSLGCLRVAGLDYLLPLPGAGAPPAMDLMVHPGGNGGEPVPFGEVRSWLETLYGQVYGCPREDPRIQDMLRPLGEAVPLI